MKFTNHTRGARGITLKDGSTTWLEPGQSVDIPKADVVEPLPDLGQASAADAIDTSELDGLKEAVASLTKQVEESTKREADLTKALDAEKASVASLTKQVEDLKKTATK